MLVRLGQVGALPAASVRRWFRTYARRWRQEEPEPIGDDCGFADFETPRPFERLVWRAVGEQLISPVRAATLVGESLEGVGRRITGPIIP